MLVDSPEGGIFGWCYAIFRISDKELELTRGLDSLVYLAYLKYIISIKSNQIKSI